jgi:hypothetical protein
METLNLVQHRSEPNGVGSRLVLGRMDFERWLAAVAAGAAWSSASAPV